MSESFFEAAERAPADQLDLQCRLVRDEPNVCRMLDLQPQPTVVLNGHRQIVFANRACREVFGVDPREALGSRFGEAVNCVHAFEAPAGCGTTRHCAVCGSAKAVREARMEKRSADGLCRIARKTPYGTDALDLRVSAAPLVLDGEAFSVVAARDASDEQRRYVLERMFFHDLLNTSGTLKLLLDLLATGAPEATPRLTSQASRLAARMVDEIEAHRDLLAAERGDLKPRPGEIAVLPLLEEVAHAFAHAPDVPVRLRPCSPDAAIRSDPVLLRRILVNLVKNAVEASGPGEQVELAFVAPGGPAFEVTNPAEMSPEVKLQVFQRSFSTKAGSGRGLGTYGARLIAERYLEGHLTFDSCAERGTTFRLHLPTAALVAPDCPDLSSENAVLDLR
jgi:nitrogen-specific signal transduction histidine kinase